MICTEHARPVEARLARPVLLERPVEVRVPIARHREMCLTDRRAVDGLW